jgi:hypothetical protein
MPSNFKRGGDYEFLTSQRYLHVGHLEGSFQNQANNQLELSLDFNLPEQAVRLLSATGGWLLFRPHGTKRSILVVHLDTVQTSLRPNVVLHLGFRFCLTGLTAMLTVLRVTDVLVYTVLEHGVREQCTVWRFDVCWISPGRAKSKGLESYASTCQ